VVGGGILGLAAARLVTQQSPGADVVVVEKDAALATHQTGHNSGVVHAGLYYQPGSLKATLCRRGMTMIRDYCAEKGLPYDECGKLVVATRADELARLDALEERATKNEVPGLRRVDGAQLGEIEPHVFGIAGLHSPRTAIADFPAIARSFAEDIHAAGGTVRTGTEVMRVDAGRVELADGAVINADHVIVCAGLFADRLARRSGRSAQPRIIPFRGEYWKLRDDRTDLVRGLIYPVPDPALPFLGVHLTRKIDGSVWVGPNAVLALAREGYRPTSFAWRDLAETLSWPGTARMAAKHWKVGIDEMRRSFSKARFVRDAAVYVPELQASDVVRAPAGVRAQAVDRDGSLVDDFRLDTEDGVVWVRNAPSPAATSSMAIAEELVSHLHLA
jgi:L-2-hydroxyglutarate oxidase LhgO